MPETLSASELRELKDNGYRSVMPFPRIRPAIREGFLRIAQEAGFPEPSLFIANHDLLEIGVITPSKIVISDKALESLNDKEIVAKIGQLTEDALRAEKRKNYDKSTGYVYGGTVLSLLSMLALSKYHDHQKEKDKGDPNQKYYAPGHIEETSSLLENKRMPRREFGIIAAHAIGVVAGERMMHVAHTSVPSLVDNQAALESANNKIDNWYEQKKPRAERGLA